MQVELSELIKIAGAALEQEDRYILGCSKATGKHGGIMRFENERYYQFLTLRGLCSRCDAEIERALEPNQFLHDLVMSEDGLPYAVAEMKCWLAGSGEPELPSIRKDVHKLSNAKCEAAYMIIFSANPTGTAENVDWLKGKIPELGSKHELYAFPTFDREDQEREFWVAGFQIVRS